MFRRVVSILFPTVSVTIGCGLIAFFGSGIVMNIYLYNLWVDGSCAAIGIWFIYLGLKSLNRLDYDKSNEED